MRKKNGGKKSFRNQRHWKFWWTLMHSMDMISNEWQAVPPWLQLCYGDDFSISEFTFFFNCINNSLFNSSWLHDGWISVGIVSHSYCEKKMTFKVDRNTHNISPSRSNITWLRANILGFKFQPFSVPFLGHDESAGLWPFIEAVCPAIFPAEVTKTR